MKIVVLQGSPNSKGLTNILVENFIEGAREKGREVTRFDVSKMNIKPCLGCVACGYEGPCVQKDDNEIIKKALLSSYMLVLATPFYYYGMSTQLKIVIDRFCSYNYSLTGKHLKSALLTVAWNQDDWTFEALVSHYKTLVRYLELEDQGRILGYGCGNVSMTKHSKYPQEAYQLGYLL